MNPTPNQIRDCTDERQLCEWAAIYCLGLRLRQHPYDSSVSAFFNHEDLYTPVITQEDYKPASPTDKGKAQCWDLAVGYLCWPRLRNGKYVVFVNDKTEVEHQDPQITVVKAAIIAALNGE